MGLTLRPAPAAWTRGSGPQSRVLGQDDTATSREATLGHHAFLLVFLLYFCFHTNVGVSCSFIVLELPDPCVLQTRSTSCLK